jgi:hypothetical protein
MIPLFYELHYIWDIHGGPYAISFEEHQHKYKASMEVGNDGNETFRKAANFLSCLENK